MRYFLISDSRDTLTGMRLVGVDGRLANDRHEVEVWMDFACESNEIAVLLITEGCAAMCPERIAGLKLNAACPLVVTIPGEAGSSDSRVSVSELIREAIGVKL